MSVGELPNNPFEPSLPKVSAEVVYLVSDEWQQNPDLIVDTLRRLMVEQTELLGGRCLSRRYTSARPARSNACDESRSSGVSANRKTTSL